MTNIPSYEQHRTAYFDAIYKVIYLHAQGKGRAKPKDKIWTNVMDMWDQQSDIPKPTLEWLNRNHPKFNKWCKAENKLIIFSSKGLYVPDTDDELDKWIKIYQKPWQEGCAQSNNDHQKLIAKKNPKAAAGLFKTVLQKLHLSPSNDKEEIMKTHAEWRVAEKSIKDSIATPPIPLMGPERELVLLMIKDRNWIVRVGEHLGPDDFIDLRYRDIFEALLADPELTHPPTGLSPAAKKILEELLADPKEISQSQRVFEESLSKIQSMAFTRRTT